jgi:diguanylate cyclase (GGDEF)-like protein/PAS domain S-box-containing protein
LNDVAQTACILIVDDDAVIRLMAGQTLLAAGLDVDEAASGEEALQAFVAGRHHLVLLDVNMDGIDGFETCARLRAGAAGQHVPIVMLTGLDDTGSIERAYAAGATDFITKPINWTLLTHKLRYALRGASMIEDVERSRARLANAQRIARLASWEWDLARDTMRCSEEYARVTGVRPAAGLCHPNAILELVDPRDRDRLRLALESAHRGEPYQIRYRLRDAAGTESMVDEHAIPVRDAGGNVVRIDGITQDVTERAKAQERIRFLAYHDHLTGLANRQFFREAVPFAAARANRGGKLCAMLHIDLDRLERVNEMFGQRVGDQFLREIAARLQGCIRAGDLAGRAVEADEEGLVARIGGDEFTVLLTDLAGAQEALTIAERILGVLGRAVRIEHQEITLSSSIGIAVHPDHGEDADALLKNAELAMYAAKEGGAGKCVVFTPAMRARAAARLGIERDLEGAIQRDELRLHFQPKIDALSGRIVGAEALLRWEHPSRGMVPPLEFIPVAEESGLIMPIGDWTIRAACGQIRRWRDAGLPAVPVSINLSSPNFRHHGLPETIAAALLHDTVDARLLRIELTESVLMQEAEGARAMLGRLKQMGLSLSVDDFGTGYSSLAYLRCFPLDELKIDRQFVRHVADNADDASITAAIIALAQQLRLEVVAEGVETEEQMRFLIARGCATMQGYLFARPMSGEDFARRLASSESCELRNDAAAPDRQPA